MRLKFLLINSMLSTKSFQEHFPVPDEDSKLQTGCMQYYMD